MTNVSGLGAFHQLAVRPGIDRPATLEVDVRAEDAAEIRRGGRRGSVAVDRRCARTTLADEELVELRTQRSQGRGVGPTRQRRGAATGLAILLVEHREGGPIKDHRLVEATDQVLQLLHRHELPGLAEHAGLDLTQRRPAVEVADHIARTRRAAGGTVGGPRRRGPGASRTTGPGARSGGRERAKPGPLQRRVLSACRASQTWLTARPHPRHDSGNRQCRLRAAVHHRAGLHPGR